MTLKHMVVQLMLYKIHQILNPLKDVKKVIDIQSAFKKIHSLISKIF